MHKKKIICNKKQQKNNFNPHSDTVWNDQLWLANIIE